MRRLFYQEKKLFAGSSVCVVLIVCHRKKDRENFEEREREREREERERERERRERGWERRGKDIGRKKQVVVKQDKICMYSL